MKKGRRKARADALQILYEMDFRKRPDPEKALQEYEAQFAKDRKLEEFTRTLVMGVCQSLSEIDSLILKQATHWRLDRMPLVDRNILRLGVFELKYCDDVPVTVTINEMVELAKEFGTENSSAFVNGVLDKIGEHCHGPHKAK